MKYLKSSILGVLIMVLPILENSTLVVANEIDITQHQSIVLGMGCFWGAQKRMEEISGVVDTEVGYAGGNFPNPTYHSVLAAEHDPNINNYAEVVKIVFDPNL
ncbi:hypothetical protein TI03_06310, partial [Achromatium sp. WMS1]